MGTDSVKLFNKALADRILEMDHYPLMDFLNENISVLQRKPSAVGLILVERRQNDSSISDSVERLLSGEQSITALKANMVQVLALGNEEIHLDYWGSYAHVFNGHPDSSISSLDYLPDQEEEIFLLLHPEHLDQMIKSLHEHADELSVMSMSNIETLERWRDFCDADPGFMVAYCFDY